MKIAWQFGKLNKHLGIHKWQETPHTGGRKALSVWIGFGLLTIYYD